jgi:hypothetical protein
MARQLQFQWPKRRGPSDPWFRVGDIDFGTTGVLVILGVLSFFVYAFDKVALAHLAFIPSLISKLELWRLLTWPLVNQPDIFTALTLYILWLFGNQLERQFDRVPFTRFVLLLVIVPALITWGVAELLGFSGGAGGIRFLELGIFVAYVAERPGARFFFGIPAWALVAVFIALDALRYIGDSAWIWLVFELVVAAVALLLLRSFGFGQGVPWVPRITLPRILTGMPKARTGAASRPKARKAAKPQKGSAGKKGGVVAGPWEGSSGSSGSSTGAMPVNQRDVDRVLDKIAAHGMDSLTADERHLLEEASRRKRDGRG